MILVICGVILIGSLLILTYSDIIFAKNHDRTRKLQRLGLVFGFVGGTGFALSIPESFWANLTLIQRFGGIAAALVLVGIIASALVHKIREGKLLLGNPYVLVSLVLIVCFVLLLWLVGTITLLGLR